jgi:hypothetical protein
MDTIYTKGTYLEKNKTWHEEDSAWKAQHILRIIRKNDLTPGTIAEIGCGAGEILHQLSIHLPSTVFTGYEISPQAFDLCKKKENQQLHFYLEDGFQKPDRVDIAMAIDVIEHIEDYSSFLRKLKEKGTYKILHIPLDLSAQSVLRGSPLQKVREDVGHIHFFSKETALAALKDTGYEIVDYFYTSAAVELPAKSFLSWLAKLPRKIFFWVNNDFATKTLGGYSLMVLAK